MIPQCSPGASCRARQAEIEAAIARVLASERYILGPEVLAFEHEFSEACETGWSVGVASGTDALELALRALDIGPGDRVATVSHTAVATVAAITRCGAQPLFADVDPERFTLCPGSLQALFRATAAEPPKAVIVVHLYGMPADMAGILALTEHYGVPVIEDCAQAHGARLDGQPVGSWGSMGCYSFYPTKNLGALGDGGAVTGRTPELQARLHRLRQYGWQERYVSTETGVNSRLDELQAAVLRVKLKQLNQDNERRRAIAGRYDAVLAGLSPRAPARMTGAQPVFHQYVIRSPERDALQIRLQEAGIGTLIHYPRPVHRQPAYANPALQPVPLPHTEALAGEILSLPMFPQLTDTEIETICAALTGADA